MTRTNKPWVKSMSNFWTYHKIQLLVLAIGSILVGYLAWDLADRPSADYTATYVGVYALNGNQCNALENCLARYGRDRDGDGDVTVQLQQVQLDHTGAEGLGMLYQTRLITQVSEGNSQLYFFDTEAWELLGANYASSFSQVVPVQGDILGVQTTMYGALRVGAEEELVDLLEKLLENGFY